MFDAISGPCVSQDAKYSDAQQQLNYTTIDDDTAGIYMRYDRGQCSEWGGTSFVKLYLKSEPTAPVLFSISSLNAQEATASPSLLVMSPAQWNDGVEIEVTGKHDGQNDGNTTFEVKVAPMITQDDKYLAMSGVKLSSLEPDEYANLAQVTAMQAVDKANVSLGKMTRSEQQLTYP